MSRTDKSQWRFSAETLKLCLNSASASAVETEIRRAFLLHHQLVPPLQPSPSNRATEENIRLLIESVEIDVFLKCITLARWLSINIYKWMILMVSPHLLPPLAIWRLKQNAPPELSINKDGRHVSTSCHYPGMKPKYPWIQTLPFWAFVARVLSVVIAGMEPW